MASAATLPPTAVSMPKNGLFKRITTKLRTPQPTASSSTLPADANSNKPKRRGTVLPRPKAPQPSLPNEFISAEQREAALLARGLVPRRLRDANGEPLPLSAREAARDERFSVLLDSESGSDSEGSEARRIREAWLARNDTHMASAACGERSFFAERRASEEELAQSRTSLSAAAADGEQGVVIGKPVSPRRPRIVRAHGPPLSPSQAELATTPSSASDADIDSLDAACDPARVPLPPSPVLPDAPLAQWSAEIRPAEAHDSGEGTAAEAGAPRETGAACGGAHELSRAPANASAAAIEESTPAGENPPVCCSPPPGIDPRSPRTTPAPLSAMAAEPHERGRPRGADAQASLPALSPTRTASSSSTAEPLTPRLDERPRSASVTSGESWRELPKIRTEKTVVGEVIVESPVEEEDTVTNLPVPRARKVSTATEGGKRGFFKRHSVAVSTPNQKPSLGGLRRSVTGTISGKLGLRPKSLVVDTTLAAQAPASSPVSPLSTSAPARRLDVPRASARQPLSPTMHTRGTIIVQAGEIEDEESRRLAEAAFLDF